MLKVTLLIELIENNTFAQLEKTTIYHPIFRLISVFLPR